MIQKKQFNNIDEYIKIFPVDIQEILEKIRQIILQTAPDAKESISYQMPAFKLSGRPLVYFAAWKNHIGFYATPSGNEAFKKELEPYKGAKGSIQFPLDQAIPYDLIKRIVLFRMQENLTLYDKKK